MLLNNLPGDEHRAKVLGHTHTGWNEDDDGPLDDRMWSDLSTAQQRADNILVYNTDKWNESDDIDDSDSSSESDSANVTNDYTNADGGLPFDHMSWDELPRDAREAAVELGYTARSWDTDTKGPWDDKRWEELPSLQWNAAFTHRYDGLKWNNSIDLAYNLGSILFIVGLGQS